MNRREYSSNHHSSNHSRMESSRIVIEFMKTFHSVKGQVSKRKRGTRRTRRTRKWIE